MFAYRNVAPVEPILSVYQTDILIVEELPGDRSLPRVVIEVKLSVTTHDALTYSAKAATHKQGHPYLRYGILIAKLRSVPRRLIWHGSNFDFMATWRAEERPRKTFKGSDQPEEHDRLLMVGPDSFPVADRPS